MTCSIIEYRTQLCKRVGFGLVFLPTTPYITVTYISFYKNRQDHVVLPASALPKIETAGSSPPRTGRIPISSFPIPVYFSLSLASFTRASSSFRVTFATSSGSASLGDLRNCCSDACHCATASRVLPSLE